MIDKVDAEKQISLKARAISECMLSTSACTVTSVVLGTFLGIRRKSMRTFVYCITFGTFGDFFYGYTNKCRILIDDFNTTKSALEKTKLNDNKVGKE